MLCLMVVLVLPPPATAQDTPKGFKPEELDQLVAPIALYPDPLIATILPAAVYPLEIVQAARFVKDTNNLAKLDEQPWDDNVKAVAPNAISSHGSTARAENCHSFPFLAHGTLRRRLNR